MQNNLNENIESGMTGRGKNKKRILIAGAALAMLLLILAIFLWPCSHEWKDATCTEAKICSKCEVTEGDALGHNWKNATCTEPSTCTICKETAGTALGHKWEKATCTEPSVCAICKETTGTALGHAWEEISEPDYVKTKTVTYSQCMLCMEKKNTETHYLQTLLSDDGTKFRIPATEYFKRLDAILSEMDLDVECSFGQVDNNVSIGILENGVLSGMVFFYKDRNTPKPVNIQESDKDKEDAFGSIQITIGRDSSELDALLTAFVAACEPLCATNPDLAYEIAVGALAYSGEEVMYPYGSLVYLMNISEGFVVLNAAPPQ